MAVATSTMTLAPAGKALVARAMYAKGEAFIGAALLLKKQDQSEASTYVFLHLLCQGIELLCKGALLLRDYDRHSMRLSRRAVKQHSSSDAALEHDLVLAVGAALAAYGQRPLRNPAASELKALGNLYRNHLLRYGTTIDIYIAPSSIQYTNVLRRAAAVIRLTRRYLVASAI